MGQGHGLFGQLARRSYQRGRDLGLDPRRTALWLKERGAYRSNRREFRDAVLESSTGTDFAWGQAFPCYGDRQASAGEAGGHYFHQDLLVAQDIFQRQPERHVDVGSSVYGFVSHIASFRPIEVIDIRPLSSSVPNISFLQADLMNPGEVADIKADSVSCLHALEHFGLGRYGDPIQVDGWLDGLRNLCRMTAPGGILYISVPISSNPRIEFDAHRVFAPRQIIQALPGEMTVESFSYVDDNGDLHRNVKWEARDVMSGLGLSYGCGIWTIRNAAREAGGIV